MKLENPLRPETGKKSIQAKEVYFGLVFQSLGFSPWVSLKDFFFYVMVRKRFYTFWSKFLCKECWQVVFHVFVWFFGVVFFSYRYLRKTKGIQKIVRIATDQNRVYSPRVIKIANQVQTWLSSWKFLLASFCVCVCVCPFFLFFSMFEGQAKSYLSLWETQCFGEVSLCSSVCLILPDRKKDVILLCFCFLPRLLIYRV